MARLAIVALLLLVAVASAKTYFREEFNDEGWRQRWVQSEHKSDFGTWNWTPGKYYNDPADKGIQTAQDAHFYALTAPFPEFSNKGKTLVIQFSVKHEQNIDCGGGYVKVAPASTDPKKFHGDSEYAIMFGPDICGPGTRKVHVIFNYKGKNLLTKKNINCESDEESHLYTLIVKPDNTYEVLVDQKSRAKGSLYDDWDFLPAKQIADPKAVKPADWDDRAEIVDEKDVKPADWDTEPEFVTDPNAKKPEDWDDSVDGEWEAPKIENPKYKGVWTARKIPNPAYKGEWKAPMIPNPEYVDDPEVYAYPSLARIAFDLWQVKAGSVYDSVIITDSEDEAKEAAKLFEERKAGETKMRDAQRAEERKKEEAERASREAEEKKRKEEEAAEEGDDEEGGDEEAEPAAATEEKPADEHKEEL